MTAPRQILPGTTYLITRRCAQRQFLLRPSETTNAIFLYILAVAADRFGILVHAFCVLSNHFHLIVTDPDARLPAFEQYLDSLVARAVNASLGRCESFWGPPSYSAVALQSPEDVIEKTAYVLANPIASGLVRRPRDWPGLWSAPEQIDSDPIVASRPKIFFREGGHMPPSAMLALTAPPGLAPDVFRERICETLGVLEERARRELASEGRSVLGVARVLAQKPWRRPAAAEPLWTLNPRIAARDKWKRIEALARLVEFVRAYRAAWVAFRSGVHDALFPPGTYGPRVLIGARCAEA